MFALYFTTYQIINKEYKNGLIFGNFLYNIALYSFLTSFQLIFYREDSSLFYLSYFLIFFSIPKIFFSYYIGKILSKYNLKKILILSNLLLSILFFVLLFKRNFILMIIITLIYSFFSQVYKISILSYVSQNTMKKYFFKINTILLSNEALGIIIGAFIGKSLSNNILKYSIFNFIIYLIIAIVHIYFFEDKTIKKDLIKKENSIIYFGKWQVLNIIIVILISIILALQGVSMFPFLKEVLKKNEEEISTLMTLQGMGMICTALLSKKIFFDNKIKGLYKVLKKVIPIVLGSMIFYIIFSSFYIVVILFIFIEGIGVSIIYSSVYSLIQTLNRKTVSRFFSIINTIEGISYVVITLITPIILKYINVREIYYFIVFLYFILYLLVKWFLKGVHLKSNHRRK